MTTAERLKILNDTIKNLHMLNAAETNSGYEVDNALTILCNYRSTEFSECVDWDHIVKTLATEVP